MENTQNFLPTTKKEMRARGWAEVDFVLVTGDAYVDHPSFAHAVISRVLENEGYRVAILAQPNWRDPNSAREFGAPRLGFLISGGNMDSMVNHYSVSKNRRKADAYSPGGKMGLRPDYAVTAYANMIRRAYPDLPVAAGGIEASLRRLGHYDYWSDSVMKSLLVGTGIDLILYGMGEKAIREYAAALHNGISISDITFINGTAYKTDSLEHVGEYQLLPYFQDIVSDKKKYAKSFMRQYNNTDPFRGKRLVEPYLNEGYVVVNPPQKPLATAELDAVYALPYMGTYHPKYEAAGGIPAIEEVQFSLISCRGCFGSCSFCALSFHQGRIVQSRSHESIVAEAEKLTKRPGFKGYIHDVGGPTANFRAPACKKQLTAGACDHRQCLTPAPCENLEVDHSDYRALLRRLRELPGVKKVFVRSGIRFDYLMADPDDGFFRELAEHHISGQLKVAPEHVSDNVLGYMGKPKHAVYAAFVDKYSAVNRKLGKNQFIVPYLMSSHPGSTLKDAVALAEYLRDIHHTPEQVQDFYPTPSTIATCMYYTGLDPRTMQPVYVPKDPKDKAMQRALIQYRYPQNAPLVREALRKAGRADLIGHGPKCLVAPAQASGKQAPAPQRYGKQKKQQQRPANQKRKSRK